MDSDPQFLRVQVWGMFFETLTFGFYLVTCVSCYRVFFTTRSPTRGLSGINWTMLVLFVLFLAKTTSSIVLHLDLLLRLIGQSLDDAAKSLRTGQNPINLSKYTTILAETVIGSGFLIYRCWLVYGRAFFVVTIPLVLWLGGIAVMGVVIHSDTVHKVEGLFAESNVCEVSFWALIIAVNITTTGLIARRVWRLDFFKSRPNVQGDAEQLTTPTSIKKPNLHRVCHERHATTKKAIRTIVESGVIYTTMTLITFILFAAKDNRVYAAIDVLVQATAITFNLIVIYNRPRPDASSLSGSTYEARMNNVPLQFVASNNTASIPGSAIEFAFPKTFDPRHKSKRQSKAGCAASLRPGSSPALEDVQPTTSCPSITIAEIPQTRSQQSL